MAVLSISRSVPRLCGVPSRLRRKCLLLAMRAFFDESGLNPTTDKVLVMGGFLGTIEEWERVSDEWDACLRRPPQIEYFKNDESKILDHQFGRFNRASAESKRQELAEIVGASELRGFCASVRHQLFANRDPKLAKGMVGSRAYDWGFFTVTSSVLQHARAEHPNQTVDFIFDNRQELRGCIATYEEMRNAEQFPWRRAFTNAGSCTSGDDREVVALQMADLLSGEFSSMANGSEPPSPAWKAITAVRSVIHIPCDLPPLVPVFIDLRSLGKEIQGLAGNFLRRFYKDEDRSEDLLNDFHELVERKAVFDAAMRLVEEKYRSDDPEFLKFLERNEGKSE